MERLNPINGRSKWVNTKQENKRFTIACERATLPHYHIHNKSGNPYRSAEFFSTTANASSDGTGEETSEKVKGGAKKVQIVEMCNQSVAESCHGEIVDQFVTALEANKHNNLTTNQKKKQNSFLKLPKRVTSLFNSHIRWNFTIHRY